MMRNPSADDRHTARRSLLGNAAALAALGSLGPRREAWTQESDRQKNNPAVTKGRIKQTVCKWC